MSLLTGGCLCVMALGSSGVILAVLVGLSYSISTGFAVSQSLADIVDHSPTASTSTGTTESEGEL